MHDYSRIGNAGKTTQSIVLAESPEVNLSKVNPISVAKIINDLVGTVEKVQNMKNGIKIICQKSLANLLKQESKFGKCKCIFTIKDNIVFT